MKKVFFAIITLCGLSFGFVSCQLDEVNANNATALSSDSDLSDFTALATADTVRGGGPHGGPGGPKGGPHGGGPGKGMGKPDTTKHLQLTEIAVSALPGNITTYISSNYAGSTIKRAAQDAAKTKYFVSIKKADSTKALLEFDGAGVFVNERTGKPHLNGSQIDPTTLPQAIKDYITKTYAGSTTQKALQTDKGYLVDVKKADGSYVGLCFNLDGTFNKEITVRPKGKK